MKDDGLVLMPGVRRGSLRRLRGRNPVGKHGLQEEFQRQRGDRKRRVWVSRRASGFAPLAEVAWRPKGDLRALVLDPGFEPAQREFLGTLFRSVVAPVEGVVLLPESGLAEVLAAEDRGDLFIGGVADAADRVLVLYRGDLDRLAVPFAWFGGRAGGTAPDFSDFEVTDHGQTIRLGAYEAATDAILYELDPAYRRRAKRRALRLDRSLGGALRRLRLQRGLSRDDFPGVSAREVARIERAEVKRPRAATLRALAARLGVAPEEIGWY